MGSKTWILFSSTNNVGEAISKHPSLDQNRTKQYVESLFPKDHLVEVGSTSLTFAAATGREVYAACYDDVFILSCEDLGSDNPSLIPAHLRSNDYGQNQCLVCLYSVVDWFAMAAWESGELVRAISVSADDGVVEDIGPRFHFEKSFWDGKHSPIDSDDDDGTYSLPFHPLEFGEEFLLEKLGYQIEGDPSRWKFDPDNIALIKYYRKPWWKFW